MEAVEVKANRRKTFTDYLVKNSESAPSKLDVRNYQLRELYNGASEESVKILSNNFMAADTNGNGEINYKELQQHIHDKVKINLILSLSPSPSPSLSLSSPKHKYVYTHTHTHANNLCFRKFCSC